MHTWAFRQMLEFTDRDEQVVASIDKTIDVRRKSCWAPAPLEQVLDRELHDARIQGRNYGAEISGAVHGPGCPKVDSVQEVEDFRSNLKCMVRFERNATNDREVDIPI